MRKLIGFAITALLFAACGALPSTQAPNAGKTSSTGETDQQVFERYGGFASSSTLKSMAADKQGIDVTKLPFGRTRDDAIVPAVFGPQGDLLTSAEYNKSKGENTTTEFVSFKTYKSALQELVQNGKQASSRLSVAVDKYTRDVSGLVNQIGAETKPLSVFVFDPYRTEYVTDEEALNELMAQPVVERRDPPKSGQLQTKVTHTSSLWVGDIATTSNGFTLGVQHGHDGVVVQLNTGVLRGGSSSQSGTNTVEATGPHFWYWDKWLDIVEQGITANFFNTSGHTHMHYMPGLSDTQLQSIRNYARFKEPNWYNFFTDKWSTNEYYCSKLIWQSYLYGAGVRVAPFAGYWALPYDIVNTPNLVQYHHSIP